MDLIVVSVEPQAGLLCDLGGCQRGELTTTEPLKAWNLGSKGSGDLA